MLPFSVRGCRRAAGLVFGTKMVLDRFWLSRDGVNRDGMAAMLIVLASVGWRQSLASTTPLHFSRDLEAHACYRELQCLAR